MTREEINWPEKKEYPNLMVYSTNAIDFMKGWNAAIDECRSAHIADVARKFNKLEIAYDGMIKSRCGTNFINVAIEIVMENKRANGETK